MKKSFLYNDFCEMYGIKYPIVLAGMGYAAGPALTAAVSNAGGLGVLGAASMTTDELPEMIKRTRELTDKPFGVDCPMPPQLDEWPEDADEEVFRKSFPPEAIKYADTFRERFGIPKMKGKAGLQVFSHTYTKEIFRISAREKVPFFVSAVGDPSWAVAEAHAAGMKIWSVIGLTRQARKLSGNGVDVIVAQGTEAGGHTGRIGTMPLVTSVINAISPKPVLAAGGIADGRGLAAALAMGAAGAWIGTAFVTTEEAGLEAIETGIMSQWEVDTWKQKILNATEDDTKISRVLTGKTLRMIKNKFQQTWEEEGGPILKHPSHNVFVADIQEGIRQNEMENFAVPVGGQISGIINKIKPAAEVVNEIVEQATFLLERFASDR
jgi:nitronate monooxygenase